MDSNLEQLVRRAKNGNLQALEEVVCGIQEKIYGLALRMLGHQEDKEKKWNSIIVKIVV